MNLSRIQTVLLWALCLLFLALYGLLAFYNRLPYEDYIFTSLTKERGPLDAMLHIYKVYSARWSAHTLAFYFSQYHRAPGFLFLFGLATLSLLVAALYSLMNRVLNGIFHYNIKPTALLLCSFLFTAGFFFSSYSIGQTWYWYMVNWMYLWSLIAGIFLARVVLSAQVTLLPILFMILLTAYIAGAGESYTVIFLLVLFAALILKKIKPDQILISQVQTTALIISIVFLSGFFLITLLAPGTSARQDILVQASFSERIVMCIKAYGIVLLKQTPYILPGLLLFSLPWIAIGRGLPCPEKIKPSALFLSFLKITPWILAAMFVMILPAAWVLYDVPPPRALSQVSLLLYGYAAWFFFCLGHRTSISDNKVRVLSIVALLLAAGMISFLVIRQYPTLKNYAEAYDQRLEIMESDRVNGRKELREFEPLPPEGLLYSDELSADSLGNLPFEKVFEIPFHVVAWERSLTP